MQRDHVRPIGKRFVGIRVDLHEESVDTRSGRGASQRFDKFPLAVGFGPPPSRQLNTMGRIEDDRIPEVPHNWEGPHIHDKIVVAK